MTAPATLVLAWGNPGRRDDGLGPAFAAAVEALGLPGLAVASDYQLQVEDAARLVEFEHVLFVDADRAGDEPFSHRRLVADEVGAGITSHSLSPGRLLALARNLFGVAPHASLMAIRGYEFDEFGEGLSSRARANLAAAVGFLRDACAAGGVGAGTPPLEAAVIGAARTGEQSGLPQVPRG